MRTEPGAAEYAALTDALEDNPTPCRDDWRFIQEREEIDGDDLDQMSLTCRTRCPLFELCDEYATAAKPTGGMWAGRYWGRKGRPQK